MMDSMEGEERIDFKKMDIRETPLRKDVVGQAGEFVDDFILAMNSEAIFKKMAVAPDKTFLITGKPGTGKSLGINALVNESNKAVFEMNDWTKRNLVGMSYDIGKYGTAYINMGSKIAQQFFDTCYSLSKIQKTVIVFDEAEVLFGNRAEGSGHKEDLKLLNTIMKNMQTVHDTPNLYAILMSNFPEAFDEASIRAGRIDKRHEFQMPDLLERKLAYEHTINNINTKADYQVVRCYDSDALASLSDRYSYADIVESVHAAVKKRANEIAKTRKPGIVPAGYIKQNRLEKSIQEHSACFKNNKKRVGF